MINRIFKKYRNKKSKEEEVYTLSDCGCLQDGEINKCNSCILCINGCKEAYKNVVFTKVIK